MAEVTFGVIGSRAGSITVPVSIEGENGDRVLNAVLQRHLGPNGPDPKHAIEQFVYKDLVPWVLSKVEEWERAAIFKAAVAGLTPIEIVKK